MSTPLIFVATQKQVDYGDWTYQATLQDGLINKGRWSLCRWPVGNRHAVRTQMLTRAAQWVDVSHSATSRSPTSRSTNSRWRSKPPNKP